MRRNFMARRLWHHCRGSAHPKDVHGPGPGPQLVQPVAYCLRGDRARHACGLERLVAESEARRQHRRVRTARAVRGSVGMAFARELDDLITVEEHVRALLAVPTGDDHDPCTERMDASGQLLCVGGVAELCED